MNALVVYGSKRGGTAGIAEMIGAELEKHGWTVEVRAAGDRGPVDTPDMVIIGGAIYTNHWHPDAREFVRRHEPVLKVTPVWLFSSGPLDDSARQGDLAPVPQVQNIARRIEARGHMTFGGRLAPDAKGFVAHSMAKRYGGDYRDPEHVAEWVRMILREFVPVEAVVPAAVKERLPAQRQAGAQEPAAT
jgi:menaquinone-dependent protoporphyrinogen oxidase